MTSIRRVVRSLLRDVIQAQHDANLFSQQLSEEYAATGAGAVFSLPAAQVGELEIEIKYAIASKKPEDTIRTEVNAREEKRFITALARELSQLIVTKYHTLPDASRILGDLRLISAGFATLQRAVYAA